MADIKAYRPTSNSVGAGQVLQSPYPAQQARLVVQEMADRLVLDLVDHRLVTDQITLTVGYDRENLEDPRRKAEYRGEITTDAYGRAIPKHAHGTAHLHGYTSSTEEIVQAMTRLFDRIVNPSLLIRRMNITANHVVSEDCALSRQTQQLSLFDREETLQQAQRSRERRQQQAILDIQKKYGKNALLKGMNLRQGATGRDRNNQIGGHKA